MPCLGPVERVWVDPVVHKAAIEVAQLLKPRSLLQETTHRATDRIALTKLAWVKKATLDDLVPVLEHLCKQSH